MFFIKNSVYVLSFLGMFFLSMGAAQAAMVSTPDILSQEERSQLATMLERNDVQKQFMDTFDAIYQRRAVKHYDPNHEMTDEEVALLNGKLAELPAGAGVNTTELLLIIILLILIL